MVRTHGWVLVGTFVALGACDWLNPSKVDEAEPVAAEPAIAATADAPAKPAEPTPTTNVVAEPEPPSVDPPPAPLPAPSEFDTLLVRLSGLPQPAAELEPPLEEVNKTAWAHYKAKRHSEAAGQFARVAARDPAWKHAHNIACASAQAGALQDARVALAESIRRGGEAAKASANKDSDLAGVRKLEWFAPLLAGDTTPPPVIAEPVIDEEDDEEDELMPANCPPGTLPTDPHYCFMDVLAPFSFAPVVFDKPITLDLAVPKRPAKLRWKTASGEIPWKELRAELGIQHTTSSYGLSESPLIFFETFTHVESPLDVDAGVEPFFWWPEDGAAILVIPHDQKLGKMRFQGVILAQKTAAGWRATNVEVVIAKQEGWGGAAVLESCLGFRFDGLELFTLSQITIDGDDSSPPEQRYLCRIRWEQGALARACAETWTEVATG